MKHCKTCKKEKPEESFYNNKRLKDGLFYSCKICYCNNSKEYYQSCKEAYKKWHKKGNVHERPSKIRQKAEDGES